MGVELTPDHVNRVFAEIANATEAGPVSCQCIIGCADHPREACTRPAEVTFEVHLLGECNSSEANPAGNRLEMLCVTCAGRMWAGTAQMVARLVAAASRAGGVPECSSCGSPVALVTDVIRGRKRTVGGIQ